MSSSRNTAGLAWWIAPWLGNLLLAWSCAQAASPVRSSQPAAPSASATTVAAEHWAALTASQKKVLTPLAGQWSAMDDTSRDKWATLATRYPKLSPDAQKKIQDRMTQWAKVPPQQRGEARLRFQNSRQLTPQERQQKWAAYQALSPEARQDLTQQALRKQKPVLLPDSEAGPREQGQSVAAQNSLKNGGRKSNLVPGAANASPKAVTPTLVKAGPGATTSLVTQTATPPLHQHAGLPRISTGTVFVDPQTMLPRKGSQGAGMTPVTVVKSPADKP